MKISNERKTSFASLRANRVSSALTALLFLSLAISSAFLMRGHATLPDSTTVYTITLEATDPAEGPAWNGWLPVADTTIIFTATVEPSLPEKGSIVFTLFDVTSYEARYMNDLEQKGEQIASISDLHFECRNKQAAIPKITWSGGGENSKIITASWQTKPDRNSIPVKIACNDYAAYGKLQAALSVEEDSDDSEDSDEYEESYEDEEPIVLINSPLRTIPKDDGEVGFFGVSTMLEGAADNKLADAWDRAHLVWSYSYPEATFRFTEEQTWLDRDEAYKTSGANSGDGLMVIEEYRGFYVGGSHTRLNPEVKDLFIRSEINETDGVGDIGYASGFGLSIHSLRVNEWDKITRVVNFCGGGSQRAVWVVAYTEDDKSKKSGVSGWTDRSILRCAINLDQLRELGDDSFIWGIIGHEVGHAIGLDHHRPSVEKRRDSSGREKVVVTFPTNNVDACVMYTLKGIKRELFPPLSVSRHWVGTGWADFHSAPPSGKGNEGYEDHWRVYKLHSNHGGHRTYDQD